MDKMAKGADIIWLKIEEALKKRGCPICSIMRNSTEHYLENLLYEYVLDVGVRGKLHKSVGFCTNHAYKLLNAMKKLNDDGLKIAILYETLLGDELVKLESLKRDWAYRPRLRKSYFFKFFIKSDKRKFFEKIEELKPIGECPACFQERSVESLYIDEFCNRAGDEEFKKLFHSDDVVLCRYHFISILKRCVKIKDENSCTFFIELQISKLSKLLNYMTEFIDKHDYQYRKSFTTEELSSWRLALEYFSGKEDVIRAWDEVRPFNTKL